MMIDSVLIDEDDDNNKGGITFSSSPCLYFSLKVFSCSTSEGVDACESFLSSPDAL